VPAGAEKEDSDEIAGASGRKRLRIQNSTMPAQQAEGTSNDTSEDTSDDTSDYDTEDDSDYDSDYDSDHDSEDEGEFDSRAHA
jgi:hypothetical protein